MVPTKTTSMPTAVPASFHVVLILLLTLALPITTQAQHQTHGSVNVWMTQPPADVSYVGPDNVLCEDLPEGYCCNNWWGFETVLFTGLTSSDWGMTFRRQPSWNPGAWFSDLAQLMHSLNTEEESSTSASTRANSGGVTGARLPGGEAGAAAARARLRVVPGAEPGKNHSSNPCWMGHLRNIMRVGEGPQYPDTFPPSRGLIIFPEQLVHGAMWVTHRGDVLDVISGTIVRVGGSLLFNTPMDFAVAFWHSLMAERAARWQESIIGVGRGQSARPGTGRGRGRGRGGRGGRAHAVATDHSQCVANLSSSANSNSAISSDVSEGSCAAESSDGNTTTTEGEGGGGGGGGGEGGGGGGETRQEAHLHAMLSQEPDLGILYRNPSILSINGTNWTDSGRNDLRYFDPAGTLLDFGALFAPS
ncbi:MAG: hypothetical protein M1838_004824 [Thelocarpon superellum]|nr:MAG: hypothetical protein M1838_004824 [Thelocarpon superellum]